MLVLVKSKEGLNKKETRKHGPGSAALKAGTSMPVESFPQLQLDLNVQCVVLVKSSAKQHFDEYFQMVHMYMSTIMYPKNPDDL